MRYLAFLGLLPGWRRRFLSRQVTELDHPALLLSLSTWRIKPPRSHCGAKRRFCLPLSTPDAKWSRRTTTREFADNVTSNGAGYQSLDIGYPGLVVWCCAAKTPRWRNPPGRLYFVPWARPIPSLYDVYNCFSLQTKFLETQTPFK